MKSYIKQCLLMTGILSCHGGYATDPLKMAQAFGTVCDACKNNTSSIEKPYQCPLCQGTKKCNCNKPNSGSDNSGSNSPGSFDNNSSENTGPESNTSSGSNTGSSSGSSLLAPLGVQLAEARTAIRELQKLVTALQSDVSFCKKQCSASSGLDSKVAANKSKLIELSLDIGEISEQMILIRDRTNQTLSDALDKITVKQDEMEAFLKATTTDLTDHIEEKLIEEFQKQRSQFTDQIEECCQLIHKMRQILGASEDFETMGNNNLGRIFNELEVIKKKLQISDSMIGNINDLELRDMAFKIDTVFPNEPASVQIYLTSIIRDLLNFKESFQDRTWEVIQETIQNLQKGLTDNQSSLNDLSLQILSLAQVVDDVSHDELQKLKNIEDFIDASVSDYINNSTFTSILNERFSTIVNVLLNQNFEGIQKNINELQKNLTLMQLKIEDFQNQQPQNWQETLDAIEQNVDQKIDAFKQELQADLTEKVQAVESNVVALKADLEPWQTTIEKRVRALRRRIKTLEEDTSAAKIASDAVEDRVQALERGADLMQADIQILKNKNPSNGSESFDTTELENKIRGLETNIQNTNQKVQELQNFSSGFSEKMQTVKEGLEQNTQNLQSTQSDLERKIQELSQRDQSFEQQIINLDEKVQAIDAELKSEKFQIIKDLQTQVEGLKSHNQETDQKIEDLQTAIENIPDWQDNVNSLKENMETVQSTLETLHNDLEKAQTDVANLKIQDQTTQTQIGALQAKDTDQDEEIQSLKTGLASSKESIESLQTDVTLNQADIDQIQGEVSGLDNHISTLQQKIAQLEEVLNGGGSSTNPENPGTDPDNPGTENPGNSSISLLQRITDLENQAKGLTETDNEIRQTIQNQDAIFQAQAGLIKDLSDEHIADIARLEGLISALNLRMESVESNINKLQNGTTEPPSTSSSGRG